MEDIITVNMTVCLFGIQWSKGSWNMVVVEVLCVKPVEVILMPPGRWAFTY